MATDTQNPSLHICLVIGSPYPPYPHGGVGSFAKDLAEGMVKRGHKVTVFSKFPNIDSQPGQVLTEMLNGVKLVWVPRKFENFPPRTRQIASEYYLCKQIRELHKQDKFDLIEGEDGGGLLALGRLPNVPKVIRLHATTIYNDFVLKRKPSRLNHILEYLWIRRADFIIAVSEYVGKTTLKLTGLNKTRKYETIPYAIDTTLFSPDPEIIPQKGLIIFTGVTAPRKGVLELIQAMNLVFEKHAHARLWIIGDDKYRHDGSLFITQALAQLREEFKDRVEVIGSRPRSELPALLQNAEICCFPSHVETFGIGIAEAMAMERPVIFMSHGPGPEVVEDGVSGLLCNTWNSQDIAAKVNYLLENPTRAKQIGVNARKRVIIKFERESWVERNITFYKQCLEEFHKSDE